ncbi:outer membrane beta-barrel protein [Roseibacterium sp. SDUM158017]|uniref:outer membrane protein n=1 Tax=Roseicyclus salinarum TaxID=3036773 RepID=UPI002414D9BA|nr:outer membrane beta-barrel protein [Roseibacterium sp. SDUM158017]MDG4647630.1 outer membrane beta-barrel protein [Roseibacterium sp. SDUM158017]
MTRKTNAARAGRLAITASALSMAAMPVFAGGIAEPAPAPAVIPAAPAPAPSADWTGFYAGGQLEYGDVGVGLNADLIGSITEDEDTTGDGFLGGVFAGYRYDLGDYVMGVELDHNAADIDLDNGSLESISRLGVEAGFDAGRALFYGTAGAANARIDVAGDTSSSNGYFYGVGMDYAVTQQVTVGAELLQHEFDDFDNGGEDVDATTFGINAAFRF